MLKIREDHRWTKVNIEFINVVIFVEFILLRVFLFCNGKNNKDVYFVLKLRRNKNLFVMIFSVVVFIISLAMLIVSRRTLIRDRDR